MATAGRRWARARVVWILLVLRALTGSAAAAEPVDGFLRVQDALTSPGNTVTVEARLVQRSTLREAGLGGERLELLVRGKPVATAMTGGDGMARFQVTPVMRGTFPMVVRLLPSPRVRSKDAQGTLASWERRRPILLVELLSAVTAQPAGGTPLPGLPFSFESLGDPDPVTEAPAELRRLTLYYFNVLYLQRGGRPALGQDQDAREWLRRHEFPPGLVRAIPAGEEALATFLDEMSESGWPNIKAAIGATRTFAEVLVEHRIHTVILPASDQDRELPRRARAVESWKEVRKEIQR